MHLRCETIVYEVLRIIIDIIINMTDRCLLHVLYKLRSVSF